MYDDDTEVARNCKVFDDYLALSCILGAGLRTERLQFRISTSTIQVAPHRHRLSPEAVQRPMGRSSGAEAVRAVHEVLLVDRFQHHDDRPLENLILRGRDA